MAVVCISGLEKHVAFRIQPFRAMVEIGRANANDLVISDDQFGMDKHLQLTIDLPWYDGVKNAQTVIAPARFSRPPL